MATPGYATANLLSEQLTGLLGSQAYLKPVAPVFATVTGPSPAPTTAGAGADRVVLAVTASRQDVADELGDVAFTALVAATSLGYDPREILAHVATKVRTRLTGPQPPIPTPPQAAVGGSIREPGDYVE